MTRSQETRRRITRRRTYSFLRSVKEVSSKEQSSEKKSRSVVPEAESPDVGTNCTKELCKENDDRHDCKDDGRKDVKPIQL